MSYGFDTGAALLARCAGEGLAISEVMFRRELELGERDRVEIRSTLSHALHVMRAAVEKGLSDPQQSVSGLSGGDAAKLLGRAGNSLLGEAAAQAAAAAMAVVEVNAAMGRIVAAPTAGASGILPGVLLTCARYRNWDSAALQNGLLCAGAIGSLIAANATIAGAEGGCQAEVGAGAAMAAAALCELSGGKPAACLDAAAIALKNMLGLVCDPVAGLVECPCIKRNAIGALNAMLACDMVLAGIKSHIPFDDMVSAMKSVGRLMSPDLKETGKGGCAACAAGRAIAEELALN